jgi:chromosome segregation ATPase
LAAGFLLLTGVMIGQDGARVDPPADPLSALRQAAEAKDAEWQTLARGLEAKIGRMLPCDARVRTTIEEVSRGSDSRLLALSQYLKAAVAMAKGDTEAAKAAMGSQQDSNKDLETERAEAEQEKIAIEGQIANLGESVRRLASLEAAQKKLAEIEAMIRQRAERAQQLADKKNTLMLPLANLLAAYQARQAALENEQTKLGVETARWSDYYAARIARAQTECSIINQTARRKP